MRDKFQLKDDAHCFVCGKANVHGLQLAWTTKGHQTKAEFYPSRTHQGWRGIVHGGILAAVLDEAMTRLAWLIYGGVVTAEMTVRFHRPARIGEKLTITGHVTASKKKLIPAKAEIRNPANEVIAEATGKVLKVSEKAA